jgi:hypothetical protein
MTRGLVVPLTSDQRVARLRYLAGKVPLGALDTFVLENLPSATDMLRNGYQGDALTIARGLELDGHHHEARGYLVAHADSIWCPPIFYLLEQHNGGKNPLAADPADRWIKPGGINVNRTCDCSGAQAWAHGFDRYQPVRAAHVYQGWLNTDSKMIDASGPRRCFEPVDRPEPGTIIVCMSGSRGHRIGHEGGVVAYNGVEWDPERLECWDLIDVVDVAALGPQRANTQRTGRGWWKTGAMFLRPIMQP